MSARFYFMLLPLLAVLMTWATWRFRCAARPSAVLAILTAATVWAILLAYTSALEGPAAEEAFNSVQYMVREVPQKWITRELALHYGWSCGLVLYALCWATAKMWEDNRVSGK